MHFRTIHFMLLIILLFCACKGTVSNDATKIDSGEAEVSAITLNRSQDSTELIDLVRKLYQWHETQKMKQSGFVPLKSNPSDTTYSGMDLDANKKSIQELKETFLFSDEFLHDYRAIAIKMDKELKEGSSVWVAGDMPPFNDDVDEWCNCQDSPVDKYWNIIQITDLKIISDEATFKWTWGDDFFYKTKARKLNGKWKISYLEGFDISYYNWAEDAARVLDFKTSGGNRIVVAKGWLYYDNTPIFKIKFYDEILFKDKSNRLIEDHGSVFLFIAFDDSPNADRLSSFLITPTKATLVADAILSPIKDYDNDGNLEFGGTGLTEVHPDPDSMYYVANEYFEISGGKIHTDNSLNRSEDVADNGIYLPPNKRRGKDGSCCVVVHIPGRKR
jgi:hypothetical protein